MVTKKKKMKNFERRETLFVDAANLSYTDESFEKAYRAYREGRDGDYGDYQKYWSEFEPFDEKDYAETLTQENLEGYWQQQTKENNYKGTLEEFIKDYGLEMDVWFINCGYDFAGVKEIMFGL